MNPQIDIPKNILIALETLEKDGFEAYIVGGCVRDSLLGLEPYDWDIATSATPEQIIGCFKNYTVILTGLQHGTITIVIEKTSIEVTTYRIEGKYSDSRRPDKVEFTSSLKEDLSRRDFTINAMAYSFKMGIKDYFEGMNDLNLKIISCVGDPNLRFKEDALRILRAVRFSSQLGFEIEDKTKKAIIKNIDNLTNVSVERIQQELNKILLGDNVKTALMSYKEVLLSIIPEMGLTINFDQKSKYHDKNVYEHILATVENSPKDITIRLTMLLHDIGKPLSYKEDSNGVGHFPNHAETSYNIAQDILSSLKYSNRIKGEVLLLIRYHDFDIMPTSKMIKKTLNLLGEEIFKKLLLVQRADAMGKTPEYREIRCNELEEVNNILKEVLDQSQCFSINHLAINGKDLIDLGVAPSKDIGHILNELVQLVIDDKILNQKESLLKKSLELFKNNH